MKKQHERERVRTWFSLTMNTNETFKEDCSFFFSVRNDLSIDCSASIVLTTNVSSSVEFSKSSDPT